MDKNEPSTLDPASGVGEQLEDQVVVIHSDGWELFDVSAPEAEEVTAFTDALPGENPDAAAFNADANPDHRSVEMVDAAYDTLEVAETLRKMRREVQTDTGEING